MEHFIIFYHGLALFIGVAAITISVLAHFKYRLLFLKGYIVFLTAMFVLVLEQSFTAYQQINQVDNALFNNIIKYFSWLSSILLTYITPFVFHKLVKKEAWIIRKKYFQAVTVFCILMAAIYLISKNHLAMTLANSLLFLSILYSILLVIKNTKHIKNQELSKILKGISVFCIILYPFMYLDTKTEQIFFLDKYFPYGLLSVPTFYLAWNIITLYLVTRYIQQKKLLSDESKSQSKQEQLEKLCSLYHITKREKEVIELIINGYTYNSISEALHISLSTVKTHIRNIYSKTEVKNKIELINLINTVLL